MYELTPWKEESEAAVVEATVQQAAESQASQQDEGTPAQPTVEAEASLKTDGSKVTGFHRHTPA